MLVHEGDRTALVGLFSLDDADRLLTSSAIRTPAIRLAQDGAVLPASAYTRGGTLAGQTLTGLVDPRKALRLFDEGATVVFQGLQRYWEPLTELVAQLEQELGHPCQANAYLTPPGSQGFAVHSDSHDVFVFQTEGRKLWEVHEPGADPAAGTATDVLLVPGLSMYLPTGTPHAARAQDSVSLHVTLGINQLTWRDVVRRKVEALLDDVDDAHLPAGWLDDRQPVAHGLRQRLDAIAREIQTVDAQAIADERATHFRTSRPSRLRGGLRRSLGARELTADTAVRVRAGHDFVTEVAPDGGWRLLLGDRWLSVPSAFGDLVHAIPASDWFTPSDLPGDADSAVVLCRRLVREGLLEIHEQ